MVLYAAYQDPRPSEWMSGNAGIPAVKVPFTVGGTDKAGDLFALFDDTVARLLAAAAARK
jgi:zinc/manganese transport system substrate-binding protein